MIFPNISIGRNTKRYTHNMSFDNNTTLPFGVVQPLMSQRLEPNAKISVNMRQLVRLAPMPVPTFARLNMTNEVCFVPTVDVCPYYEALVSQQSFSSDTTTFYPTKLPQTDNSSLLYLLLVRPEYSYYSYYQGGKTLAVTSEMSSKLETLTRQMLSSFGLSQNTQLSSSFPNLAIDNYVGTVGGNALYVTPDGADFVLQVPGDGLLCFRLSEVGRRLRSALIGLGYSLNPGDTSAVSIIPMLSYYKAWFDLYYPIRDLCWTDSPAYKLIKLIENYRVDFHLSTMIITSYRAFALQFLPLLASTFYTSSDDIVSVHRASQGAFGSVASPRYLDASGKDSSFTLSQWPVNKSSEFGLITLQALQRFTRYFSKNSVIGKRISSYLKVHYGASVANSLYKDSNHIGKYSFPLSVDDVFSSSDTFDVSMDTAGNSKSSGELLGSYAGKGIGFDKSSFDFTAPTFGYFFVLSSVSTPTGYFQGNSGDLYVTDFDHVPNPDFDCLGYEVSPRGQFIGTNGVSLSSNSGPTGFDPTSGFGYVPRYTGLKYHKNIVNGDISRRSTASSLSAYHLNRIITPIAIFQNSVDSSSSAVKIDVSVKSASVPSASTEWRYLAKNEWLGNYNRIFYNSNDLMPTVWSLAPVDYQQGIGPDDNFIVQTVFDVRVTDQYKPLSQAWDTYEESTDDSSVDVKPE